MFKTVKIQQQGGQQLLALPERFRISDDTVYVKRVGNMLYVIPFHDPWRLLFDSLEGFDEDFMKDSEQPKW
jgi:antitoxin VapB